MRPQARPMSAALQRVTLNLPPKERKRLRSLAKAARMHEAVYARELLVEGLARAERAAFRKRLEASRGRLPAIRAVSAGTNVLRALP